MTSLDELKRRVFANSASTDFLSFTKITPGATHRMTAQYRTSKT